MARVKAGQGLSERQALEALLLPSANNIATLLARWDACSLEAFVTKMNQQARRLGLKHTSYADASGVDSATMSSANDQARLATAALRKRVFAQIVSMRQAQLPVAGVVGNLNPLLGRGGVFGVKTGSTSGAGRLPGVRLARASRRTPNHGRRRRFGAAHRARAAGRSRGRRPRKHQIAREHPARFRDREVRPRYRTRLLESAMVPSGRRGTVATGLIRGVAAPSRAGPN